jgi:aldehyde:ferredoxin oxidoreductase
METIIRVDMKHVKVTTEKSPGDFTLLGGRGLCARILNREVRPLAHPLSHENKLVAAPGLLAGTMAPSFGRISFGAKSPLTYTIKETNAGGTAAQKLDRLGIKALILEGKPRDNQIYCLYLDAKGAQLISAPELEGKKNYELAQILREKYGKDVGIISIGPAGEAKMSAASIAVTDQDGRPCRHAGRGGLGAVMGSKGIKAIIINAKGTKPIEPADKKGFAETVKGLVEMLKQDKRLKGFSEYGTPGGIQFLSDLGTMPSWNYHGGPVKGIESLYGEAIFEVNKTRGGTMHGCMPGCVVRCSIVFHGDDGSHLTSALEYETLALLGTNLAITDLDAIARMDRMCDELGVDTIEVGSAIAQFMEAGVVKFGDKKRVLHILEEIGTGGHIGRIVGHGTAFTARYLGLDRVPAVKGQAIPAHDPRACKAVGVTYSTSPMGADHTAGITYEDSLSKKGQAKRSHDEQILNATLDTVGYCMLATPSNRALLCDAIANLLNARYGTHLNGEEVLAMGLRTIKDELRFNRSAGWSPVHDRVPEFMRIERLPPKDVVFDVPQDEIDALFEDAG